MMKQKLSIELGKCKRGKHNFKTIASYGEGIDSRTVKWCKICGHLVVSNAGLETSFLSPEISKDFLESSEPGTILVKPLSSRSRGIARPEVVKEERRKGGCKNCGHPKAFHFLGTCWSYLGDIGYHNYYCNCISFLPNEND